MERLKKVLNVLFLGLILNSCSENSSQEDVVGSGQTIIISTSDEVSSVQDGNIVFSSIRNDIKSGDIIVSGITQNAPKGFLRKVTSLNTSNNQTMVSTSEATIEEAINGHLNEGQVAEDGFNYEFQQSDLGRLENTTNVIPPMQVQIDKTIQTPSGLNLTIEGTLNVKPSLNYQISVIKENGVPKFTSMYFLPQSENELTVTVNSNLDTAFDKEWELVKFKAPPVTLSLAGIPVVVFPEVVFFLGVNGDLNADLNYTYTNKSLIRSGFAYTNQWILPQNNGLTVLNEGSNASVNVTGNCKVYLKSQFNLFVYDNDFVSCGVNANPYANFNAVLNANAINWDIKGGIDTGAYFKAQVFGQVLVDKTWDNLFNLPQWNISSGSYPFDSSVTDIDGNNYGLVQLGSQRWFKQNLRATKNTGGGLLNTGVASYYKNYDNNPTNAINFGGLYWNANNLSVVPAGYRIPTKADFETLLNYYGSNAYAQINNVLGFNNVYGGGFVIYSNGWNGTVNVSYNSLNNIAYYISSTQSSANANAPVMYFALKVDNTNHTVSIVEVPYTQFIHPTENYYWGYSIRPIKN